MRKAPAVLAFKKAVDDIIIKLYGNVVHFVNPTVRVYCRAGRLRDFPGKKNLILSHFGLLGLL